MTERTEFLVRLKTRLGNYSDLCFDCGMQQHARPHEYVKIVEKAHDVRDDIIEDVKEFIETELKALIIDRDYWRERYTDMCYEEVTCDRDPDRDEYDK